MTRSKTIATPSRSRRLLAVLALGIVVPVGALACGSKDPEPQQPVVVQQPPPAVAGISAELMAKISLACDHIVTCKNTGNLRGEHESCMRDLAKAESYQGNCGNQQVALIECIDNARTCDQTVCASQSAAVTACGVVPPGLINMFFPHQ